MPTLLLVGCGFVVLLKGGKIKIARPITDWSVNLKIFNIKSIPSSGCFSPFLNVTLQRFF